MTGGRGRIWAVRAGLGVGVVVVLVGAFAAWNWSALSARHAAYQLRTAATDEDRAAAATKLAALGDDGLPHLADALRGDDPACCRAAVTAVQTRLADLPPDDPRYAAWCRPLLDGLATFSEPGRAAALDLIPTLLRAPCPDGPARCRDAVRAGLTLAAADGKVRAVRLALRPDVACKADVAPLLDDPAAEVRRAAMLAVGPADESAPPVVDDEQLFRFLHDPDPDVGQLCEAALKTRGLDAEQVMLVAQLVHPDPAERLKLLLDLRAGGEAVRDPGRWLERLSRDPDPAVRLGAARVGCECRLAAAPWLDHLADHDADPTVRKWAGYYRNQTSTIRRTGYAP